MINVIAPNKILKLILNYVIFKQIHNLCCDHFCMTVLMKVHNICFIEKHGQLFISYPCYRFFSEVLSFSCMDIFSKAVTLKPFDEATYNNKN